MLHYPVEFPADAAEQIVKSVRGEAIDKAKLVECAWNIAGYALKYSKSPATGGPTPTNEEVIALFEAKLTAQKEAATAHTGLDGITPRALAEWAVAFALSSSPAEKN